MMEISGIWIDETTLEAKPIRKSFNSLEIPFVETRKRQNARKTVENRS